jgi:hypothetical protein
LPAIPLAQSKPEISFYTSSIRLSDLSINGSFELIFNSYPTKEVDILNKDTYLNLDKCNLKQLGWVGAYRFWNVDTKCGHLCFEIPDDHALWDIIDYPEIWKELSFGGLPSIWRIKTFTNTNDRHIKQTVDFSITIENELRSNRWV